MCKKKIAETKIFVFEFRQSLLVKAQYEELEITNNLLRAGVSKIIFVEIEKSKYFFRFRLNLLVKVEYKELEITNTRSKLSNEQTIISRSVKRKTREPDIDTLIDPYCEQKNSDNRIWHTSNRQRSDSDQTPSRMSRQLESPK